MVAKSPRMVPFGALRESVGPMISRFLAMASSPSSTEITTGPAPLETAPAPLEMRPPRVGLSLFWRTFFLLSLLLIGSIVAWLQTFRALEFEPRAVQTAQQIASLVNLSRAALIHSDAIQRVSLIKTLADQEGVRIVPREPTDRYGEFADGELDIGVMDELLRRPGLPSAGLLGLNLAIVAFMVYSWKRRRTARASPCDRAEPFRTRSEPCATARTSCCEFDRRGGCLPGNGSKPIATSGARIR